MAGRECPDHHRCRQRGNPAAEAFRLAAGEFGYRLFGLCLFSAGVSSVVGAAFTSVSFLKTLHPFINKYERQFVVGFIAFSTLMMVIVATPPSCSSSPAPSTA